MSGYLHVAVLLTPVGLVACSIATMAPSVSLCPEPKHYSADEEKRAAAELIALPPDSIIATMIVDYARERAELRACRGEQTP